MEILLKKEKCPGGHIHHMVGNDVEQFYYHVRDDGTQSPRGFSRDYPLSWLPFAHITPDEPNVGGDRFDDPTDETGAIPVVPGTMGYYRHPLADPVVVSSSPVNDISLLGGAFCFRRPPSPEPNACGDQSATPPPPTGTITIAPGASIAMNPGASMSSGTYYVPELTDGQNDGGSLEQINLHAGDEIIIGNVPITIGEDVRVIIVRRSIATPAMTVTSTPSDSDNPLWYMWQSSGLQEAANESR